MKKNINNRMKIIYIAGPFTAKNSWEIEQNIRHAEEVGYEIMKLGHMPLIPHANTRFFHGTFNNYFFITGTLELMKRCDAIILCKGWENSSGSIGEKEEAERFNIPIFYENEINTLLKGFLNNNE